MLFSNQDIQTPVAAAHTGSAEASTLCLANTFASGERLELIRNTINGLQPGCNVFFKTDGAWSNIELLEYLLELSGPANIYFSTWSISSEAITRFTQWEQSGAITGIFGILDAGLRNRKPDIYQQATGAFKVLKLSHIHAKVTVISSDTHNIVLMGSANYTRNPRIEAGMIIWNDELAQANIKWILEEIYGTKA